LLTRRAARLLRAADVVVADRRATDAVLALAPATAQVQDVGGTADAPGWSLDRLVGLLAAHAVAGHLVVRLESGDPFVSSRAAAEVSALRARGVTVTFTPGVSAATVAPLAAGMVPVAGTTVTIASGAAGAAEPPVDWSAFAEPGSTLVVLMAPAGHGDLAPRLMAAGVSASTPVAVVHAAGRPGTQVAHTDLAGLGDTLLPSPTTLVVGPMRRGARFTA
jgi:uroporphyrin-III C-methyltransferase